jgi:hypothetical protein
LLKQHLRKVAWTFPASSACSVIGGCSPLEYVFCTVSTASMVQELPDLRATRRARFRLPVCQLWARWYPTYGTPAASSAMLTPLRLYLGFSLDDEVT